MAITLPRTDLMTLVRFQPPFVFDLARAQEISRQRSGAVRSRDLTPGSWRLEARTVPLDIDDMVAYEAALRSLDGSIEAFEAFDVRRPFPRAHPNGYAGTATISSITTSTNRTMRVTASVAGLKLSTGDYFAYTLNGVRRLHQIMEDVATVTTAGGQSAAFEVRPAFPPGITTGIVATLNQPRTLMIIEPDSIRPEIQSGRLGVVSFSGVEV